MGRSIELAAHWLHFLCANECNVMSLRYQSIVTINCISKTETSFTTHFRTTNTCNFLKRFQKLIVFIRLGQKLAWQTVNVTQVFKYKVICLTRNIFRQHTSNNKHTILNNPWICTIKDHNFQLPNPSVHNYPGDMNLPPVFFMINVLAYLQICHAHNWQI